MDEMVARLMQEKRDASVPDVARKALLKAREKLSEGEFTVTLNTAQAMILLETQSIGIEGGGISDKMTALVIIASVEDWAKLQQKMIDLNDQVLSATTGIQEILDEFKNELQKSSPAVQKGAEWKGPDTDRVEGSLRADLGEDTGVRWRPSRKH